MELCFLGAAREVTGSRYLLNAAGKRILIDCGMEQGADIYENQELPVPASGVDCVVLTHAHIDHSGMLPALYKDGFRGPIYATPATMALCEIMLRDSAHIQMQEAQWRNRKAERAGRPLYEPIYDMDDADGALGFVVNRPLDKALGEVVQGGLHYSVLFTVGLVLFVITFAINLAADVVLERQRKRWRR